MERKEKREYKVWNTHKLLANTQKKTQEEPDTIL